MSSEAMRGFVRALCDALASRDISLIGPHLHDDVDWTMYGPIDLFPFFGQRRGKDAVLDVIGEMTRELELRHCEPEKTLVDGENAAALVRLSALHVRSGRTISVRLAHFATARDGKLASLKVLMDTLDAAEQTLGREIDLSQVA